MDKITKEMLLKGLKPIKKEELLKFIKENEDITCVDTSEITDFSDTMDKTTNGMLLKGLKPVKKEELLKFIKENEDVTSVDTSEITDFSYMFWYAESFNQDISNWDVSSGVNFNAMFYEAENFNQDISNWDVSNGTSFFSMFYHAESFKQDISNLDVLNKDYFYDICNSLNIKINKKMINDNLSYIYCDNVEYEKSDIQISNNDFFELMITDSDLDFKIESGDFEIVILFDDEYFFRNENKYSYIKESELEKLKELDLLTYL